MSSKNVVSYVVGQAYAVVVGHIEWLRHLNLSRAGEQPKLVASKGDKGGVWESIRDRGWSPELPVQGIALPYNGITADDVIKDRQRRVAEMEKLDDGAPVAAIMRQMWMENGKWIKPLFIANSGFTRGLSLPGILLDASKQAAASGSSFDPATFKVQVVVRAFASEYDRVAEQSFENESRRMAGTSDMTWPDRLQAGQYMLEKAGKNANQRLLRKAFGDGNGMKTYGILIAASRFGDELNLLARLAMPKPADFRKDPEHYVKGGYIPASAIPQVTKDLQEAPDADAAEKWLAAKVYGVGTDKSGNKGKAMDRKAWESATASLGIQDGSPMHAIQQAHLNNEGLGTIKARYPQLFSKLCVLTLGKATDSKATGKSKSKSHAKA